MHVGSHIEVEIGPGATPGEYAVRVVHAAAGGQPTGTLNLDVAELLHRRDQWEGAVLASSVTARRTVPAIEQPVRELGRGLFEALFAGSVRDAYRAGLGVARGRGQDLRLVLRLTAPELAVLPWETMFDPETGSYLCRREPLVRYVDAPFVPDALDVSRPLRILGLVASPRGLPALDVEAEQERLTTALAQPLAERRVELDWVLQASWDRVHERLLSEPWHVVHFVGHGDFDPELDEGVIALVGENGRPRLIEASLLADLLNDAHPTPRLVVLNSCASGEGGTDLFSGTAAALVHSGIDAVVAMQFSISDDAAIQFAKGFYTALAEGRGIDEATRSGRIAILGLAHGTLEWVTPVLYLRGNATHLFNFADEPSGTEETGGHFPRAGPDSRTLNDPYSWLWAERSERTRDPGQDRPTQPTDPGQHQTTDPGQHRPTQPTGQTTDPGQHQTTDPGQHWRTDPTGQTLGQTRQWRTEPSPLLIKVKPRPVPIVGPIVLAIPLLLLAWNYAGSSSHYSFGKPWQWFALYSAALGIVIAPIEGRRHRIRVWTVALEYAFIWFVAFMIYSANFEHIRTDLRPLHIWQPRVIIAGAGAVFGFVLLTYILIRMGRRRKPAVPALLPVFVGCLAAGLCCAALGYRLHPQGTAFFGFAAFLLFIALLADVLAPFLERKRPPDQRAASGPGSTADTAGLVGTGRPI
jgi:hypothetical protein